MRRKILSFTPGAKRIISEAQREFQASDLPVPAPVIFLSTFLQLQGDALTDATGKAMIDEQMLQRAITTWTRSGSNKRDSSDFKLYVQRVVEAATQAAIERGQAQIGVAHLLLGMLTIDQSRTLLEALPQQDVTTLRQLAEDVLREDSWEE